MPPAPPRSSWSRVGWGVLFLVLLGLLASRRWEQWIRPEVWDEDSHIVRGFIDRGWLELLYPESGYSIFLPKAIDGLALSISPYFFPLLSTALAWIVTAAIGVAVAAAPTHLRGRALCALALFFVPSNPEVFGIPLYLFWWSAILLILLALWDESQPSPGWRLAFLVVGGLSSPFIFIVLPVLYARALARGAAPVERRIAGVATVLGGIQFYFVRTGAHMGAPPVSSLLKFVVPKFGGWFLVGNLTWHVAWLWTAGGLLAALVAVGCLGGRRRHVTWILAYLYLGAIAASVVRVDPAILDPRYSGPRYFFIPFVLSFWILIQLGFSLRPRWLKIPIALAALLAAANAGPVWARRHVDLQWKEHVRSARLFPEYAVPIQLDGGRFGGWWIVERGAVWNRLLRRDWLISARQLLALPTFAYRLDDAPGAGADSSGIRISRSTAAAGARVTLRLFRGSRVRFRSGAVEVAPPMRVLGFEKAFLPNLPITKDWVILEFSNSQLPREFTVEVEDQGFGVGEWMTGEGWR